MLLILLLTNPSSPGKSCPGAAPEPGPHPPSPLRQIPPEPLETDLRSLETGGSPTTGQSAQAARAECWSSLAGRVGLQVGRIPVTLATYGSAQT